MPVESHATLGGEGERRSRRDRLVGLTILLTAFCLSLGISWWAKAKSRPQEAGPPRPPVQAGIAGYPRSVDPLQALSVARGLTQRTLLGGVSIDGVRADGTVDLDSGAGRVFYVFRSPPGQGPQPARDPGERVRHLYCGRQMIALGREGMVAGPDMAGLPCSREHVEALPDPGCGPRELWRHALQKQPKAQGLAKAEYYRSQAGPAWRFDLSGSMLSFTLYGDCARELDAADAQRLVP
jgi:hypothetical protein